MSQQMVVAQPPATKPRFRGWIHVYCAAATLVAGSALVALSWTVASRLAGHATLAYTIAIVAMFAVSATYHRIDWGSVEARAWMRRLISSVTWGITWTVLPRYLPSRSLLRTV